MTLFLGLIPFYWSTCLLWANINPGKLQLLESVFWYLVRQVHFHNSCFKKRKSLRKIFVSVMKRFLVQWDSYSNKYKVEPHEALKWKSQGNFLSLSSITPQSAGAPLSTSDCPVHLTQTLTFISVPHQEEPVLLERHVVLCLCQEKT